MSRFAAWFGAFAVLAAPASHAQTNGDKARIDEFSLPPPSTNVNIDQLTGAQPAVASEQKVDRSLAEPGTPPASARGPTEQVGVPGDRRDIRQVAPEGDRTAEAAPALSRREESRPHTIERLGGSDRCDPQAKGAAASECRRIVELRARQFQAVEAPRLSAEQELLARQDSIVARSAADLAGQGAARRNADAAERAVQELGFVAQQHGVDDPAGAKDAENASLSDAIKGILVDMGVIPH